jgi:hypothetical protein
MTHSLKKIKLSNHEKYFKEIAGIYDACYVGFNAKIFLSKEDGS